MAGGGAWSNATLSDERDDRHLLMRLVLRLKVTSQKLMICLLASMVMHRPF